MLNPLLSIHPPPRRDQEPGPGWVVDHPKGSYILSAAAAYFCVIADNDFLNDPHNLIYTRILLMLIFFVCASTVTLYVHSISHESHTGRTPEAYKCRKKLEKLSFLKIDFDLVFFRKPCLSQ